MPPLHCAPFHGAPFLALLIQHGWAGLLLTALGIGAAGWSVRDGLVWRRLRRGALEARAHDCHKYIKQ